MGEMKKFFDELFKIVVSITVVVTVATFGLYLGVDFLLAPDTDTCITGPVDSYHTAEVCTSFEGAYLAIDDGQMFCICAEAIGRIGHLD